MLTIKTSSPEWLAALAKSYKTKRPTTLVDDAGIGVNPINDTLFQMGKKANLGFQEWVAVLIGLGISAAGAFLLVAAVLDPEPYSKIGFVLATSGVMIMGGGWSAMHVLTNKKPPKVTVSPMGFVLEFA